MRLQLPLKGIGTVPGVYKTQGFGEHPEVYSQFGINAHNGLDYGAPKGTPVLASHSGELSFVTQSTGYGKHAFIYDGEFETVYGHFDSFEGVNRQVKAGEVIGYVDSTGFSTGHHLHFGVRRKINGQVQDYNNGYLGYLDPMELLFPMSNSKLAKKGGEWGFYLPAVNEAELIGKALNFGYPLPTKNDGKEVDWDNLKPDITI